LNFYLTQKINLDNVQVLQQFHRFVAFYYFASLFGHLASSFIGKLSSIIVSFMVFFLGNLLLLSRSMDKPTPDYIGFYILISGLGGMRSSLLMFWMDQFQGQTYLLKSWLFEFYYIVHLGAAFSSLCLDFLPSAKSKEYQMGLFMMGSVMILGFLFLVLGITSYNIRRPEKFELWQIVKCYLVGLIVNYI
jgi:dipeptide/tripeptide permease